MRYNIRQIAAERKFCDELSLDVLAKAVPLETIQAVLSHFQAHQRRHRKLTMVAVVLLLITMNFYPKLALGHALQKLAKGLRFIWPDPLWPVPTDSAISYRRYQLGPAPVVALFRRLARPIATPHTKGAFAFGLRLMAIDSSIENVPDTQENSAAFGRTEGSRGQSPFPQIRGVYLVEVGTHIIVDAGLWPVNVSERVGGFRLLRSVAPEMLVMWDKGFHGFDMIVATQRRQAQVLARLPSHVKPEIIRRLEDGSSLAYLRPAEYQRRKSGEKVLVRVMTYALKDPGRTGYNEPQRIVTTLLDDQQYPALDMICLYHERWEIEMVFDEMQTHQRLSEETLRSLKAVGVIQEFYALLIAHYALRWVMHEAALREERDPDGLSFVHALSVVEDAVSEFQMVERGQIEQLYERMLKDIAAVRLPKRRPRVNARVVKRKEKKFQVKRSQHYNRPPLVAFRDVVALI